MRKPLLSAAFAASLLLTACGGQAASSPPSEPVGPVTDLDSLVEAAEAEGEVLLYTALTEGDMNSLVEAFEAKYDIEVQALRLGGTDAATRFDTETSANAPSADILALADSRYVGDAVGSGALVNMEETGLYDLLDEVPEHLKSPDGGFSISQIVLSGVAYNTENVSSTDVPGSWEDLLDSRWTGKLVGTSPDASVNNLVVWGQLYDTYGADFVSELGAQVARTYPNMVPQHEALSAGDGDLALQSAQFFIEGQKQEGKPLEFVHLSPSVYPVIATGVSERAQHPNAARLLAHFMMTEEGTRTVTDPAVGSFSPYDDHLIPEDFAIISAEDFERYEGMRDEIMEAFGK
ncbi:extracellular solute-binding protein [Arthrobacter sp. zg-Y1219]|uniref:extracellular solute-binding protein n=1 Tax=Arthrobacter sp. zg-Y1219 TaxID=3049067 RepID=UPI0024C31509|nr:extracellular solute-binding protein [Arthrobacter sp. zg-Y1219]MDK1361679.1 extracellular solute-binding protein [Arthrobacter sp. zg-Y1219]